MTWLTEIFRDATKVKEFNSSDELSIIIGTANLTANTYTSEYSYSSDKPKTDSNWEGEPEQNFHPTPQPIEGKKSLGDKILKESDAPIYMIPPNGKASE